MLSRKRAAWCLRCDVSRSASGLVPNKTSRRRTTMSAACAPWRNASSTARPTRARISRSIPVSDFVDSKHPATSQGLPLGDRHRNLRLLVGRAAQQSRHRRAHAPPQAFLTCGSFASDPVRSCALGHDCVVRSSERGCKGNFQPKTGGPIWRCCHREQTNDETLR